MRTLKSHFFNDYLHDRLFEQDDDNHKDGCNYNNASSKWETTYKKNQEQKEISQDLFSAFHNKSMDYSENPNPILKNFLDEVKDSKDFKSTKDSTMGNDFLSYFAGKEFQDKFASALPELNKKMEELQKNPNNQVAQKEAEEYIKQNKSRVQSKLRQIVRSVEGDLDDVKEVFNVAGFDMSQASNQNVDMKGKLDLAKKLTSNKRFKEIIEMIGRRVNLANHHLKTSTLRGSNEVVGIEHGRSISDLIPSELAMLQDDDLSTMFVKGYSNSTLCQWQMKGKDTQSDGDIIIVDDQSGSMSGDLDLYAKSFIFGMWIMAKNTNKKLHVIPFSSRAKVYPIENENDCMKFIDTFMGGGTNYDHPLQLATQIIETESKKADVFFLTDGEGALDPKVLEKFLAEKEKNGFKVMSVNLADGENETLKLFSDKIWNFTLVEGKASTEFLNEAFSSVI